ncbi:DUF3566 domain-containing protein [Corynebacterium testudinoris]|uniref:DUF3566 domain-containing protein n=1 Tax=Corynebacterium testudinoris TaxID=136857 RepID=A0A0G3H6L3_9CORY|nr:DUF3566 domain-containing protein [Corynebacterium testudinoris]AKK07483.1 Transmembrane domain of unknown function (DUF3566) [Corynebacterium testudinoris]MBX8995081.1 DUF3566 domain-containing protein [Corynebacterium testudinoris]
MAKRDVAITRIAPLSAFRVALAMSLVGLVAWLLTVVLLYIGMDAAGVWDKANSLIGDVGADQVISFGLVISIAALLGAIWAILVTVLAPLGAIIYNAIVDLFGGIQMRLQEEA